MAVQPLNKTKIIKKKTNKIRRYQSDEFGRVKVRQGPTDLLAHPLGIPVGPRELLAPVGVALTKEETFEHQSNVAFICDFAEILEKAKRC